MIAQPPPAAAKKESGKENTTVKTYQKPSLADLKGNKFSSADGRFTIALPKSISGFSALTPQSVGINASGSRYQWTVREGFIIASYLDFLDKDFNFKSEQDYVNYFAGAIEGVINDLKAKLINSENIKLENNRGVKMNFELSNGLKGTYKNYIVNKRQYVLLGLFEKDIPESEKLINQSFDTLTIISQASIDEELRRKIERSTPSPLPQELVPGKEKSDAEDDNLKGKVKTLTQEDEDLSGTWSVQGRHISSITDYNEKGNQIKRLFYDSKGIPNDITVFGYIDGARVRKSGRIETDSNPPIMAFGANTKETAKPDLRYDYKHEYKYKDGKLVEDAMIRNNGKLWLRYVYNYKGNEMEELVYDENGKLNQKYLSVLDDKGNEIENISFDVLKIRNNGDEKYVIKYDSFDEKGNWTKRTRLKVVTENGKQILKPYYSTYRTFTYYQ